MRRFAIGRDRNLGAIPPSLDAVISRPFDRLIEPVPQKALSRVTLLTSAFQVRSERQQADPAQNEYLSR